MANACLTASFSDLRLAPVLLPSSLQSVNTCCTLPPREVMSARSALSCRPRVAWMISAMRSGRSSQLTEALMYTTLSVPDLHSTETSSDSDGRSMLRVASLAFLFRAFTWSTTLANKVALSICTAGQKMRNLFLKNHTIVLLYLFILLENSKAKAGEM
jgi:hypothetical protein